MCDWGTTVPVEVSVTPSGKRERAVRQIDACIAPIVAALDAAGIIMTGSCCGHESGVGEIRLADGRVLAVLRHDSLFSAEREGLRLRARVGELEKRQEFLIRLCHTATSGAKKPLAVDLDLFMELLLKVSDEERSGQGG